jgi:hypothetical protein
VPKTKKKKKTKSRTRNFTDTEADTSNVEMAHAERVGKDRLEATDASRDTDGGETEAMDMDGKKVEQERPLADGQSHAVIVCVLSHDTVECLSLSFTHSLIPRRTCVSASRPPHDSLHLKIAM